MVRKEQKILAGAEPIFTLGNSVGFLFVHGFTGGPYEGRELAKRIHREIGATVSVPLLPGHGTAPENLRGVHWLEWYGAVRQKYFELKENCDKVVVCGLSMGGALSLHLASHHPVDGVISMAGAVFLKDWRLHLLPLARHIIPYQYKSKGPDMRNKELKQQLPSYRKYPVRSVDQLLGLLNHVREDLAEVTAPALLVHSRKDRTVHFDNLRYIYDHISSEQKEMLVLENSYHIVSLDVEKDQVFRKVISFVKTIVEA